MNLEVAKHTAFAAFFSLMTAANFSGVFRYPESLTLRILLISVYVLATVANIYSAVQSWGAK